MLGQTVCETAAVYFWPIECFVSVYSTTLLIKYYTKSTLGTQKKVTTTKKSSKN